MRRPSGLTMVEMLMVVLILGILATIVVPNFTEASTEARMGGLCEDLQMLRSQIALYKVQHEGRVPSFAQFRRQLTETTTIGGSLGGSARSDAEAEAPVICGPYLKRIPVNPFNRRTDDTGEHGAIDDATTGASVGDDGGSWEYDGRSGRIWADDSFDADGDGLADHRDL